MLSSILITKQFTLYVFIKKKHSKTKQDKKK